VAERVDYVECAHALEAHIREQRMIAIHQPKYNRRSRSPNKVLWVVLTSETFPRLSIVSTPPAGRPGSIGPFPSRRSAATAVEALEEVVRVRRCSQRLPRSPKGSPCALAELGRCGAPCAGREDSAEYAFHIRCIDDLVAGSSDEVLSQLRSELDRLGSAGRFDQAAMLRDRLSVLAEAVDRRQRLGSFAGIEQLVTARPDLAGGWELAVIRYGRLAAAGRATYGVDPMAVVHSLTASAETVIPVPGPLPAARCQRRGNGDPAALGGTAGHPPGQHHRALDQSGSWRGTLATVHGCRRIGPIPVDRSHLALTRSLVAQTGAGPPPAGCR